MATSRQVARLVAYRRSPFVPMGSTANFSASASRAATPAGPPQPGFRLPPPKRWDQGSESSLDKASKYFLMAEMFRGMYVVLEQFFPTTVSLLSEAVDLRHLATRHGLNVP